MLTNNHASQKFPCISNKKCPHFCRLSFGLKKRILLFALNLFKKIIKVSFFEDFLNQVFSFLKKNNAPLYFNLTKQHI